MDPQQDIAFEKIGGYRVLRRLATGGTSDVLLARAEGPHGFERTVVLKLLLSHFRNEQAMEKMFAREAAAYARLSHPAIVKLYDFFAAEGQLVMVLEYVDGLPLNRLRAMLRQAGESLDDRASIFIAARIFAALAAAHGARDPETGEFAPVIHRDVNPSNVLIPWDGHVKLADFGIAKVAGIAAGPTDTKAGFIKGTYGYMAPEQVKGEAITVRADVYAASLLLWELLARRKAIQRGALPEMEVLRAMAEPSIVSLDVLRPDLPARLREAVARGLTPAADQRAITADEMLAVLRESVASQEGRTVLVEAINRVRPEMGASRPPEALRDAAVTTPDADEVRVGRASRLSSSEIEPLRRTAAGLGGGAAVTASQALARSEPPPGVAPIRNVSTLRLGVSEAAPPLVREAPSESPGAYRSAAPVRPLRDERTMRGLSPMPNADASAAVTVFPPGDPSMPPAAPAPILSIAAADSQAPVGMTFGGPPSLPPVLGSTLSSRPMPVFTQTNPLAPMAVPISTPPPPPPDVAAFDPFPVNAAGAPAAPLYMAPPSHEADAPPSAPLPDARRTMTTYTSEARKRRRWVLVSAAGLALAVSGVAALALVGAEGRRTAARVPASSASVASIAPMASSAPAASSTSIEPMAPSSAVLSASASAPTASASASASEPVASASSAAPPASGSASASASATASATAPAAAPTHVAVDATHGELQTPGAAPGHRIYVDEHVVGTTPEPVRVRCGSHAVKIGSRGVPQTIEVPCGGEVTFVER